MRVSENEADSRAITLRRAFWVVACFMGLHDAVAGMFAMNHDGISYLDVGDALLRGDFALALNGTWSPAYPFLLGLVLRAVRPSPFWEFPLVHAVNFAIFVTAIA